MNIIEKATRRLEELRRAGIDVPFADEALPSPFVAGAPVSLPASSARGYTRPQSAPGMGAAQSESALARQPVSKQLDIDLRRLSTEGYLAPDDARMTLAEELQAVKRPIIDHARESWQAGSSRGNLILVTSAMPGEGKTYCAINLAMSIAMEVDHSVLLVDADVVRPSIMTRLGLDAKLGMLDVLTNPSLDLSEVLIRSNIPKLTLLPAGSATAKSTELLASAAMERLLADLAARYSDRIIIFDAPPLLVTSESHVLASRMGQVLMVVQAQKTSQSAVLQALSEIQSCETVWCLLNKARSERIAAGYDRFTQMRRS